MTQQPRQYSLGHRGGVDADTVDGLHAEDLERYARFHGGGGPEPCTLDDYIIKKISTERYSVLGGDNDRTVRNESGLVAAIQWAHDQGDCISVGVRMEVDMPWEAKLTISNTLFTLHGKFGWHGEKCFKAKNALNDDMIYITGNGAQLYNFGMDGNKTNQSAGTPCGINIGACSEHIIENVEIAYTKAAAIQIVGAQSCEFRNITVDYVTDPSAAIYLSGAYNNSFIDCKSLANNYNWYIDPTSSKNTFLNCYGQQASNGYSGWLISGKYNQFNACRALNNARHGFWLFGAQLNTFNGCVSIDNSQQTDETYNGFYLSSNGGTHCLRNSIQAIIDSTVPGTIQHAYGIREEDNSQNRNIVASGTVSINSKTGEISLQGANSLKSADCIEV